MYKCITNFSCGDGKYFKGKVYKNLPSSNNNFFIELKSEKREVEISGETVETASIEKKTRKRKK
tara:strand:- start:5908 stop:6099 length:192 start_codon:yes stop_codon:yes gene_type:complete